MVLSCKLYSPVWLCPRGEASSQFRTATSRCLPMYDPCSGPHILNGMLDLTNLRIPLGASRLVFATLILIGICTGVLLGLYLGGTDLPVDGASRHIVLRMDVLAAGAATASYSIYFYTPPPMLVWPIIIGMIAHAAWWWVMST